MKNYVVGFYFDHLLKNVVLIWKNKPDWQAGKLNGVGGKTEDGETELEAMRREFLEEAGIDHKEWVAFVELSEIDWKVTFFFAIGKESEFEYAQSKTDEEIAKIEINRLWDFDYIHNLEWLIPMALHRIKHPSEIIKTPQ